jgi:hypothetical protein
LASIEFISVGATIVLPSGYEGRVIEMLIEEFAELIINHENRIRRLEKREGYIVGSLQDVQDQVNALVAEDSVVIAALNDLKQKADAGQQVTSEDLQGLHDQIAAEVSKLNDAVQATDPPQPEAQPAQPDQGPVDVSPNPATQPDATPPSEAPTTTPATDTTTPDAGGMTGPVDSPPVS